MEARLSANGRVQAVNGLFGSLFQTAHPILRRPVARPSNTIVLLPGVIFCNGSLQKTLPKKLRDTLTVYN